MRICLIGDCGGHIGSAFDSKADNLDYVGAAVSGEFESMDNILRYAAEKGRSIPLYDDWKQMLTELHPDIAVVDTVFSRHSEVSRFALERGICVYSEKPAATELTELVGLEAAVKKGGKLFSMLTLRFDPWFYTAKRLTDGGAVGDIRMINGQKSYKLGRRAEFFKNRQLYGGTIPWVSIHMIDQILWLTGKKCLSVSAIQSSGYNCGHGDLETAALINMQLEGDIMASVSTDYCRPISAPSHGDDRIRIVGTDGILEVRGERVYLINKDNDGTVPLQNFVPEKIFDGFLNVLSGSNDPIYRDCDGLYAAKVAICARESAETGKILRLDK